MERGSERAETRRPRALCARGARTLGVLLGLVPALVLASAPRSAAAADEAGMRRLLRNLAVDSERLQGDTESFLRGAGRWEPSGRDRDLWNEVGELVRSSDQLDRAYLAGAYPGFQDDARRLLLRGRTAERLLLDANMDRRTRDSWARVRDGLRELASSQGWDYDRARFEGGGTGSSAAGGAYPGSGRRYTASDDREVGQLLGEVRRNADTLTRVTPYKVKEGDVWKGVGISIARDVAGLPESTENAPADPLVADLAAFQKAAADAELRFQQSSRAADVEAEVRSLQRLADRIDAGAKDAKTSKDFGRTWDETRRDVDRLAAIYGLR